MSGLIERDRVLNLLKKHKSGLQGMKGPLSIVEYYIGKLIEKINEMPSAEPERKKGKWLMNGERYGHMYWRCSLCGEEVDYIGANFCSNCGSYNGGEQSETD